MVKILQHQANARSSYHHRLLTQNRGPHQECRSYQQWKQRLVGFSSKRLLIDLEVSRYSQMKHQRTEKQNMVLLRLSHKKVKKDTSSKLPSDLKARSTAKSSKISRRMNAIAGETVFNALLIDVIADCNKNT